MTSVPSRWHHRGTTPLRRRRVLVAGALALTVAASGCTGTGDDRITGAPPSSTSADSSTTPSTGTGTATGGGTNPAAAGPVALGAKWDWSRFTEFEPFLKTLAGGRTYYELEWCDIEKRQGVPDWASLDRIVDRSNSVGVAIALKLRVGTCWATGGEPQFARGKKGKTESAMPSDMNAYRAWVRSLVARYSAKGVHDYAIENEINSESFWAGTPEQFASLAQAASTEIRAADPKARVVDAGLSSTTYGYGIAESLLRQGREADAIAAYNRYYERRFGTRGDKIVAVRDRAGLERALTSEQGARNLAYLRLMTDLARRKVVDVRQIHFYEKYTAVPDLFAYLRANTPTDTPIEAWEVGRFDKTTGAEGPAQAQEMVKTVSLVLAEGADVAIWLPLAFDPTGRNSDEPRFGLLEPDGRVRDVGRMFQAVMAAARGAQTVKVSHGAVTGVGFEKKGVTTAFVWADRPTSLTLQAGHSASRVGSSESRTGRITVGPEPLQLKLTTTVNDFLEAQ